MGQRPVRAKSRIRQAGIPFRIPGRADLRERLDGVLDAIYAAYAEGWTDAAGTDARRRNLAEEAIWLSGRADWAAIEALYQALETLIGSPVVAINRAIAVAETRGPQAGLELLDSVATDARLADHQPYWAARAALLARSGATREADQAYERAIGLERDAAVRQFLQRHREKLARR